MGAGTEGRKEREKIARDTLLTNERKGFDALVQRLLIEKPEGERKILEKVKYLIENIDGIRICGKDPEANNGGCTEPHVSNILSLRLSSRPMKWSKATLVALAPILALKAGLEPIRGAVEINTMQKKAVKAVSKEFSKPMRLGLMHPEIVHNLTAMTMGKQTPLRKAVKGYV